MSYGFIARNDGGAVVISNDYPVLQERERFTVAAAGESGGIFEFTDARLFPPSPQVVLACPDVGSWISRMSQGSAGSASRVTSNQGSMQFVTLDLPQNMAPLSTYGRILMKDGVRVWDASRATAAVVDGVALGTIPSSGWTYSLAGNAIWLAGGYAEFFFPRRRVRGVAARRTGTNAFLLEYRNLWLGSGSESTTAVFNGGVSALTARVS